MLACNHHSAVLQDSISSTAGAASSAAEAASSNLPEPVRDVLSAAKGPISQAFSQVHSPWGIKLTQLPRSSVEECQIINAQYGDGAYRSQKRVTQGLAGYL